MIVVSREDIISGQGAGGVAGGNTTNFLDTGINKKKQDFSKGMQELLGALSASTPITNYM